MRTARVFADLDKEDAPAAKRVFDIAQPALVRAKEYELCAKYLSPEADWLAAAQFFQFSRQEKGRFGPEHKDFMERSFTNKVGTLLGLLVLNGRRQEAERIAQKARLNGTARTFTLPSTRPWKAWDRSLAVTIGTSL